MSRNLIRVGLAAVTAVCLHAAPQAQVGTLTTVSGRVVDLSTTAGGDLLFCTAERDVGRITTAGVVTTIADAGSGPFPKTLRGVLETPAGDVAVLDVGGDVYTLPGASAPALLTYDDLYMIQEATDFVVDASGSFVIASRTPSTGTRGVNWISADGQRWIYYLVAHAPVALAADAVAGDILLSDLNGGGSLRVINTSNEAHPAPVLDDTTGIGSSLGALDGDLAVETDGSVWMIGGGSVYRHDRGSGVTTTEASGLGQLRGIAIAASSGLVPSASGWSVYLAEGEAPTTIREIGGVGAPHSTIVSPLGQVPGRGKQVLFFAGQQVFEMAVDLNGDLLVGGHLWGSDPKLMRVDLPSGTLATIATEADGLIGRIEGIHVDRDGSIYVANKNGRLDRITENPLTITNLYVDTMGDVGTAKDMVRDRDGSFYLADREGWDFGHVEVVDPTFTASPLATTEETRGLALDPFTGDLLVTEWRGTGFEGQVGRLDLGTGVITPLPLFSGMNYTNADGWGDGDLVMDVEGNVYTVSEDDWCVYKYDTATQRLSRIASGYLNHPSGCAIARSTDPQPGESGWSLYVAEFDWLWELPDVAAPAPTRPDQAAPRTGFLYGYLPGTAGVARSLIPAPGGNVMFVTTSNAEVYSLGFTPVDREMTRILSAADGLSGDLVATTATSIGTPIVANTEGEMWALFKPGGGAYVAQQIFSDPTDQLGGVTDIRFTASGTILVHDRPSSAPGGKLYELNGRTLDQLAFTNRGERMAFDPLSGDLFVTQRGNATDGGGELLRVDTFQSPPSYGHYRGDEFFVLDGGGIAFDAAGNVFVSTEADGRVVKVDRATGARVPVTGNYMDPTAIRVLPGRPGTSGPMGTSLFVLDRQVVYEVPVQDLAPPGPPASPPGLAPPAELSVQGFVSPGDFTPVTFTSPNGAADAGKAYAVFSTLYGKVPGVPMSLAPDFTDTRVIPSNYDSLLWKMVGNQGVFPGLLGVLDASGSASLSAGFQMPDDPYLMTLESFVDMVWLVYDPSAQNGVDTIGGTAHLYIGY